MSSADDDDGAAGQAGTRHLPAPLRPLAEHPLRVVLGVAALLYLTFIARATAVVGGQRRSLLFDDAMVSMVFARRLAEGDGLTWNDGTAVEGYTNLLWTLWMALVHAVGFDGSSAALAVSLSGAAILLGLVVVAHRLAGELSDATWVAVVAAAATACCYPLVFWTLRGMEVGLVALLVTSATLLTLRIRRDPTRRRILGLGAVLGLAVLTRNDALVPAAALLGALLVDPGPNRRSWVAPAAITAGAVLAQVGVRLALYGELLPNTYVLKMGGTAMSDRLGRGVVSLTAFSVLEAAIPLGLVAALVIARRADRAIATVLAPALAVLAYSAYVGGDAWEWTGFANRYLTIALPLLLVVAVVAIERLQGSAVAAGVAAGLLVAALVVDIDAGTIQMQASELADLRRAAVASMAAVLGLLVVLWRWPRHRTAPVVAGVLLIGVVNAVPVGAWVVDNATHVERFDAPHVALGLAARAATEPDATIAVFGAGATPYYARRATVDLLGKADPVVAHGDGVRPFYPGHTKWDYQHSICERRPDLVLELWAATPEARALIEGCGYTEVQPGRYVESSTDRVDVDVLLAELERLGIAR